MNRLKKHRGKITAVLILALLLIIAYFGNRETTKDNKSEIKTNEQKSLILPQNKADFVNNADEKTVVKTESDAENKTDIISESELDDEKEINSEENNPDEETEITSEENNPDEETEIKQKEKSKVDETTADKTDFKVNSELKVNEAPDAENKKTICTISVRCDTVNKNIDLLDESKRGLIPSDGVIFKQENVVFEDGESVFDVLLREMKNSNIHFEYVNMPMYDSAYIEGINNIYEFDCGELSGWMYRVNGVFPGSGCSQYKVKDKDVIEVVYTCDMGKDVGKN